MDASTQTAISQNDYAHSTAIQSRGDRELTIEEDEAQRIGSREFGGTGGGWLRSGLHSTGNSHIRQRGRAASSGSAMSVKSNPSMGFELPLSIGETFAKISKPSAKERRSTFSVHLQKGEELKILNKTVDDAQAESKSAEQEDIASAIRDMPFSAQSLRRRSVARSQSVPASRDSLVTEQEAYVLKVCRALMMCGAPTHRLEEYMHRTKQVFGLRLQSFYMPGCMIISFSDAGRLSNGIHIVRCPEALNLSKLDDVHAIHKDVFHNKLAIGEATVRLEEIMARGNKYPPWFQVLMYGLASLCIGPVSFGARPIDLPAIFLLGSLLGFMQLIIAERSELYRHVFEISTAILTSFLARALGSIHFGQGRLFCFSALSQACLVMILPGFTITNSALELQSKNMVSGSVRMIYGVIFALFLTLGITIGTTIYGAMDSDATSATKCATVWPFWWQITFVAPFTVCYIIINQGKWKKTPAMVALTLIGWTVNYFSAQRFTANVQITQTLGAFAVGILANTYSRVRRDLAVALMYPAIFIQVPGSLAATGSLISGLESADNLTRGGPGSATPATPNFTVLQAGYAMIEIAIGITVGLSVSTLVVYPFRERKGKSGFFSF